MSIISDATLMLTKEQKDPIYDELYDAMIEGLDNGTLTVEASENSAEYIYDKLDKVTNQAELFEFLEKVSTLWDAYKSVYLKHKGSNLQNQDDDNLSEVKNNLNAMMLN
jgi:hypothetical protein